MNILEFLKKIFRIKKIVHTPVPDDVITEEPKPSDYIFRGETQVLGGTKYAPDGQWLKRVIIEFESQIKKLLETMGCVSFSALTILEMLAYVIFNFRWNKSDRFTAKMSGTTKSGNSATKVGDSTRKDGLTDETEYPFLDDMTYEQFYAEVPKQIIAIGQKFLTQFQIQYEWVPFKLKEIKEALTEAPLQVYVPAWYRRGEYYYSPDGMKHNHATVLVGYKEGEYWEILDSYDPYVKRLEWNFNFFPWALKYSLSKRAGNSEAEKLYNRFLNKVIWLVQAKGELIRLLPDKLKNIPVFVGDEELLLGYGQYLTDKKKVTPVSNEMYETIKSYYQSTYGSVQVEQGEPLGMEEIMKKL